MGFLDKVIGAVNRVGTPIDSFTDTIGPSKYKRGDQVAEEGDPAEGRITGIECKLDGSTDTELFALQVGGELRRTRIPTGRMERLRLGMPVLLRVDDQGRAVLDWPAMCFRCSRSCPRVPAASATSRHPSAGRPPTSIRIWTRSERCSSSSDSRR